jgi:RHH-type transcriptional regulator, proline utilization regulon repressor / proline dehydrogenase / delta 1-pyrroline-5-carboxylate dehydrogenase
MSMKNFTAFHNEPDTDFARPENQDLMRAALSEVRGRLGEMVPIVIDDLHEESATLSPRYDPSQSERIISRSYWATPEQAGRAIEAAARAFPSWRETDVYDRINVLRKVAEFYRRNRFEISAWQVFEVGKPWREADADVSEAIDFCEYYAVEMERLAQSRKRNVAGEWNEYTYDARGPSVIIAPWNFPLAILTGMAAAALVTGNTICVKPAEQSSRVGYFLQEALQSANLPKGVANFLPGKGEVVGAALVNDPRVALIAFTGSKEVGLSILKDAANVRNGQREIKRVIAELGGKNSIIVDEDADLDDATLGVLASAFGFAGQKCSACSRVIVVGAAYSIFCRQLANEIDSVKIGPAEDPATTIGPVVDEEAQERVANYRNIGMSEGRLLTEAEVPPALAGSGFYVSVSAFVDCPPEGQLSQDEIFGPILTVHQAANLDEALLLAANTPFALTGGLYSRSPRNIDKVRKQFRVGNLYINRKITGALVDRQPFGGAGMSGVGSKAGGPDYLLQFVTPRTITQNVMRHGFAPSEELNAL